MSNFFQLFYLSEEVKMLNLCDTSSSSEDETDNIINLLRQRRVIRPRINFSFPYISSFKERFRVSPTTADNILNIIGPLISHRTLRNHALGPKQQLLIALLFFGSGSQYNCVGDMHGAQLAIS